MIFYSNVLNVDVNTDDFSIMYYVENDDQEPFLGFFTISGNGNMRIRNITKRQAGIMMRKFYTEIEEHRKGRLKFDPRLSGLVAEMRQI